MKSFGLTLQLKDETPLIEQYKAFHKDPWPEVVRDLRGIGITEMKIYLLGRRLFMYMETRDDFDPKRDFPKLDDDPRYRQWGDLMASMQERAQDAAPDEWWAEMEEVFDLSSK